MLLIIFISELSRVFRSKCCLFADDLKLWKEIKYSEDTQPLQQYLNALFSYSVKYAIPIIVGKCLLMPIDKNSLPEIYTIDGSFIVAVDTDKDLDVLVESNSSTSRQYLRVETTGMRTLLKIRCSVCKANVQNFKVLFFVVIWITMKYWSQPWCQRFKKDSFYLQ